MELLSPLSTLLLLLLSLHMAFGSVEETCKKATEDHRNLTGFCVTTLQAAPGSDKADTHGLAVIITTLNLANYTLTVAKIKELQKVGDCSEHVRAALRTCRQRYIFSQDIIHSATQALKDGRLRDYVADMGTVRSAPTYCEDAHRDREHPSAASVLRKEDDDAFNLATTGMLIARLL